MPDQPAVPQVYRFGPFEADPQTRILRKQGSRIRLQNLPFQVLILLLEAEGRPVTREEIRKQLWAADTFVDFEHGLNAAVNKLRQTLNDSAEMPRYVETLARVGYRLLVPVARAEAARPVAIATAGTAAAQQDATARSAAAAAGKSRAALGWIAGGVLACAVIFGGLWTWKERHRAAAPPLEPVTVLLSDFENSTGDAVFDNTLKQALAVQLEQSPYLDLVPDERVREALRYMGRSGEERVTPLLGIEICQRENLKALVTGSIASLGSRYVLSLNAVQCPEGSSIARVQMEAENKEAVLHTLDQAVPGLRRKLGESLSSIEKYGIRIEDASTPSVEAMKAYTVGLELRARGKEAEAVPFFKHAIELDANFAMAYARLGTNYTNMGESLRGAEYLKKAYALRERVSEKERFYIEARYYDSVSGEIEKANETYELWRRIYPQDALPNTNLAAELLELGSYERAVEAARTSLRLNPDHTVSFENQMEGLRALGRLEEAKQVGREAVAAHRDIIDVHVSLYAIAFAEGDAQEMQAQVQLVHENFRQDEMEMRAAEAAAAAFSGKLQRARELYRNAEEGAAASGFPENAATSMAQEALWEAEFGNAQQARQAAKKALKVSQGEAVKGVAALALARAGETALAEKLAMELEREYPLGTRTQKIYLPTIRAAIALDRGDAERAIELLHPAREYELGIIADFMPVYVRGLAQLQARAGAAAGTEFQKIVERRGVDFVSPYYALARLGLGRAQALAGATGEARKSYEEFLRYWKEADADLPLLQEAKSQFAKLGLHSPQ